ncbi:glycosyltransferase family 61 protein [Acetobacter sp. TBRC 12305]|uniref:Glycosyltransferase family 61 protein n=1 Tax=Acetobacter garciniae TaxID=2817435 RepID=A0A939HL14_9PROT|nr:glycosyltransferase family 61 protein [Acetobacter garciniae]MBO1323579.1 glycosyltransferase family 61 protein [Acetobacter garciniae]MBX0343268.1 glycosyltransferase family 61 protein [Acetobacter garciniae]
MASRPIKTASLFTAAGKRALMEISQPQPGSFACDGLFPDGAQSLFRAWRTAATPLYRYTFGPAAFDPALTLFGWNNLPLHDTLYTQPQTVLEQFVTQGKDRVEHCRRTAWAGFDHWSGNYYHWVAHTLPALRYFLDHAGRDDVFLLPPLTRWQEDSLDLVGLEPHRRMMTRPGTRYEFERVIYTDFIRGRADFTSSGIARHAYASLRSAVSPPAPAKRFLFIDRGDAPNRHVPNGAELTAAFMQLGFERVHPERLSLREQIDLFAQARMVAGFLGAGLANIAWCQAGALVYELVPSHHQNPCFLAMSIQGGLQYWGELVQTGVQGHDHTSAAMLAADTGRIIGHARVLMHRAGTGG